MSDVTLAQLEDEFRASDRKAYFEQRIFVLSPFGTLTTAALIFALLAGTFLLSAALDGEPILARDAAGIHIHSVPRLGLVLSLLLSVILAIQRLTRMRQRADTPAMAKVLRGGLAQAKEFSKLTPDAAQLWQATSIGVIAAFGIDYLLYFYGQPIAGLGQRIWLSAVTLLLVTSFVRGVELTRAGSRGSVDVINDMIVDLLRIEDLAVWGRGAARFAVIWFTISAVSCLLFVSSDITPFTVAILLACLGMGVTVFVSMMMGVHRRIVHAKKAELERVRTQIDDLRLFAASDANVAARLQGILAYEARIAAVQEWPFDQTTLLRVCASALILTVPWFGQAIAAYVVDHLSRIGG